MSGAALQGEPVPARLRGEDVGIPVRKLGLQYGDNVPEFWFGDNALLTCLFASFSASLPGGEGQFIHSVRNYQDQIKDPLLMAQVRAFIGQEAQHSREHEALNKCMQAKGYPIGRIERLLEKINKSQREHAAPKRQLVMTVCGEHITALMADYYISKNPETLGMVHPSVRKIWAWHSIEESEHKAVAFDVYMKLVGDRKYLCRQMRISIFMFLLTAPLLALYLLMYSGRFFSWKTWREGLPLLWRMLRDSRHDFRDFYKPDFHPSQHDNTEKLNAARARYLGEYGPQPG
ncbi:MAG: metal-dependent hydrolase [Nevskia sp.]|nr:metal-dependent hydrolase [Nevskia sp.]